MLAHSLRQNFRSRTGRNEKQTNKQWKRNNRTAKSNQKFACKKLGEMKKLRKKFYARLVEEEIELIH